MRSTRIWGALAALAFSAIALAPAAAQEAEEEVNTRVSLGFAYIDDGSCGEATDVADVEYVRSGGALEARGIVRVAPSGGNCRERFTAASLELEQAFDVPGHCDGLVKLVVDRRAFTAPYAQVVNGMVDLRADGMANFPVDLPAGIAETYVGAAGWSCGTPAGEFDLTVNAVPVDFADGTSERTLHVAWNKTVGPVELGIRADLGGQDVFGEVHATWTYHAAVVSLAYDYGLHALHPGAPPTQQVRDAHFALTGAPGNSQLVASFRVGVGI